VVTGEPVRVSMCHCLACQRRTGGPFGAQARFARDQVQIAGHSHQFVRMADEDGESRTFHFCPECGTTVHYGFGWDPEIIVIPIGAFADPGFPAPTRSVWEERKHAWVTVPDGAERID
jgi:hypothetical protein